METEEKNITITPDALKELMADEVKAALEASSVNVEEQVTAKVAEVVKEKMESEEFKSAQKKTPIAEKVVTVDVSKDPKVGYGFLALAQAHLNPAVKTIEDAFIGFGKEPSNYYSEATLKVMNASIFSEGGALIPEMWADDIIPYLQSKSVFRAAGMPTIDMPKGILHLPKATGAPTMGWRGESETRTTSQPSTGSITMSSKIGYIDVPVSDQLLRYGGTKTAQWLQNIIIQRFANGEDYYVLLGTGASGQIKGIEAWMADANSFAMESSSTAVTIKTDMLKAIKNLEKNDVEMINPIWVMNPIDKIGIMAQTDANSNAMDYAKELSTGGTLFSIPVWKTTRIVPASSLTKIFLIDLGYVLMGEGAKFNLEFKKGGGYWDGSNYITGDARGESVFTAEIEEDLVLTQEFAASQITGVDWGA